MSTERPGVSVHRTKVRNPAGIYLTTLWIELPRQFGGPLFSIDWSSTVLLFGAGTSSKSTCCSEEFMVEPLETVGLGLCSAASHDASSFLSVLSGWSVVRQGFRGCSI